jgi:hypothetical protein
MLQPTPRVPLTLTALSQLEQQEAAKQASRRQLHQARAEAAPQLPCSLEEFKCRWDDTERNIEELLSSLRLNRQTQDDVMRVSLIKVAFRDLRRYEEQMTNMMQERSETENAVQRDLAKAVSTQAHQKLRISQPQLNQDKEIASSALQNATGASLKDEEMQARAHLAQLDEDLAALQDDLVQKVRCDGEELPAAQVAEAEKLLQESEAKDKEAFDATMVASDELLSETDRVSRLTGQVDEAHRILAEAGLRSHEAQADLDKLRAEIAEAEQTASRLRSAATVHGEELRAARTAAGGPVQALLSAGSSIFQGNTAPSSEGYSSSARPQRSASPMPSVAQKALAKPAQTPPRTPQMGELKIEDLENSLLSIVRGNDALEQRLRGGKKDAA